MIPDADDRIQLPPTLVDFDNVVGITGQAHDNYPAGSQQPRWDWMRSYLIGLLANQSSNDPPTQYRIGTIWYNRIKSAFEVWNGSAWISLADVIVTAETTTTITTLTQSLTALEQKTLAIQPRMTFSGHCEGVNVSHIPIPSTVQTALTNIASLVRPLVYINGRLADPRSCAFDNSCPSQINLSGTVRLQVNDVFTVVIERFDVFLNNEVITV